MQRKNDLDQNTGNKMTLTVEALPVDIHIEPVDMNAHTHAHTHTNPKSFNASGNE